MISSWSRVGNFAKLRSTSLSRVGTEGMSWSRVGTEGTSWLRVGNFAKLRSTIWSRVGNFAKLRGTSWLRVGAKGTSWSRVGDQLRVGCELVGSDTVMSSYPYLFPTLFFRFDSISSFVVRLWIYDEFVSFVLLRVLLKSYHCYPNKTW